MKLDDMKKIIAFVRYIIDALNYKINDNYSLRSKGKVKIPKDAIVLDVGSGANPSLRADVLLEKHVEDIGHRVGKSLQYDERPLIIGDAKELPFANDSFDYIICQHVLEHIESPLKLAQEFRRVSKRGYIESPSPFIELIHGGVPNQEELLEQLNVHDLFHGYGMRESHKWFLVSNGRTIFMLPKTADVFPIYLIVGYFIKNMTRYEKTKFFSKHKSWAAMQYEWSENNSLDIRLLNDCKNTRYSVEKIDIEELISQLKNIPSSSKKPDYTSCFKKIFRKAFYKSKRNFDIVRDILACPICKSKLERRDDFLLCKNCGK